jgi:hypothetical protein
MTRRKRQLATAMIVLLGTTGCVLPWFKKDDRTDVQKKGDDIREVLESEERPHILLVKLRSRAVCTWPKSKVWD